MDWICTANICIRTDASSTSCSRRKDYTGISNIYTHKDMSYKLDNKHMDFAHNEGTDCQLLGRQRAHGTGGLQPQRLQSFHPADVVV